MRGRPGSVDPTLESQRLMQHILLSVLVALSLAGCASLQPPPTPAEDAPSPVATADAPSVVVPLAGTAIAPAPTPPPHWATRAHLWDADEPVRIDLWERIRAGFAAPDLDDDLVRKWEAYYAGRPDYVARMTERGGRYLFHIVEEVGARGLPMELALLPFIESAFNPQALSSARAAGMWQFMPATGRDFDLKQNLFRDDRRDVLASTRAALDYLQRLHTGFGDWHLALASYNWGQGNVSRAIRRNAGRNLATDYGSLRLPDETRNYVPKLQAIKNIVARPEAFGLTLPALENHPYFLSVPIERDIDVALAAELAGISIETFQQFNPQMNKPVILAAGTPQVLLPYDDANRFVRALQAHPGPLASWTAWVAPRTLKPADAARLTGISERELLAANRIPPRMLVKAGSTLLVPRAPHVTDDVEPNIADNAALLLAPDALNLRRVVLRVGKKGDTVALVARRYRLDAAEVARWNKVGVKHVFKPGSRVVVMVPPKKSLTPVPLTRTASQSKARARNVSE
jgi:membrane-bound lytic murein transglycosylase D